MHGFLNIDKPAGITSHDVVARIRRLAGRGVRVGHAGTLDPAATGVLPIALGSATRLIEYLADARKAYRGLVRLGSTTTTDDGEGEPLEQHAVPSLDPDRIESILAPLRGPITQIPPRFSALRKQGRRLYELARQGEPVEPPPRQVTIYRLDLIAFHPPTDLLIAVECSKGTYIRSLARDIGAALACGGHLAQLTRTSVGTFNIAEATPLTTLEIDPDRLQTQVLPPETAIADWPAITLTDDEARRIAHGMAIGRAGPDGRQARAHTADGKLLAVLRRDGDGWHPEKVLQQ
jgi:tRNA pseudouridine55 synthase